MTGSGIALRPLWVVSAPSVEAIRVRRCAAGSDGSARGGSVGSNPLPMRESRSSGAIRSERVAETSSRSGDRWERKGAVIYISRDVGRDSGGGRSRRMSMRAINSPRGLQYSDHGRSPLVGTAAARTVQAYRWTHEPRPADVAKPRHLASPLGPPRLLGRSRREGAAEVEQTIYERSAGPVYFVPEEATGGCSPMVCSSDKRARRTAYDRLNSAPCQNTDTQLANAACTFLISSSRCNGYWRPFRRLGGAWNTCQNLNPRSRALVNSWLSGLTKQL